MILKFKNISSALEYAHIGEDWMPVDMSNSEKGTNVHMGYEYLVVLPFLVVIGLITNILSLATILASKLRRTVAGQYLIALTMVDSTFLLGVIAVFFKIDHAHFIFCVLAEYVLMTASYVNSWLAVQLTIERFLATTLPLKHFLWKDTKRWKIIVIWLPIPFLINLVQFVALEERISGSNENERKCAIMGGNIEFIMELLDIFLCYLVPFFTIVILNIIISIKIRTTNRQRRVTIHMYRLSQVTNKSTVSSCKTISNSKSSNSLCEPSSSVETAKPGERFKSFKSKKHPSDFNTRIPLVVSLCFIVFNTPIYALRILETIAQDVLHVEAIPLKVGPNNVIMNSLIVIIYNTAHYLYFMNFISEAFVYVFVSGSFRRNFLTIWASIFQRKRGKTIQ